MQTSVNGFFKSPYIPRVQRWELPREKENALCSPPYDQYGQSTCPFYPGTEIVIEKNLKVPSQARMVSIRMYIEIFYLCI